MKRSCILLFHFGAFLQDYIEDTEAILQVLRVSIVSFSSFQVDVFFQFGSYCFLLPVNVASQPFYESTKILLPSQQERLSLMKKEE